MAESPSHKFGQIVGNLLETILRPVLQDFCDERGLYLDIQGTRPGVRSRKKVTWVDKYGNAHDLDFVIEKGGTASQQGRPVAFIEAAWRRYTKHSRNKAQEIQSAVLPIAESYHWDKPFLGAVLAGVFTKGSLDQLKSVGFRVLYFPYTSIVAAFDSVGIDAQFDESTSDADFRKCIRKITELDTNSKKRLKSFLVSEEKKRFDEFLDELSCVLDRLLDQLIVIPLFGNENEFSTFTDAIAFVEEFVEGENGGDFRKYEIIAKYSNGDSIDASFRSKEDVLKFLRYLGA